MKYVTLLQRQNTAKCYSLQTVYHNMVYGLKIYNCELTHLTELSNVHNAHQIFIDGPKHTLTDLKNEIAIKHLN